MFTTIVAAGRHRELETAEAVIEHKKRQDKRVQVRVGE